MFKAGHDFAHGMAAPVFIRKYRLGVEYIIR